MQIIAALHGLLAMRASAQQCDVSTLDGLEGCSYLTVGRRLFECKRDLEGADKVIFASRINDGVCDCCDGSDEDPGGNGALCANRCESDLVLAKRSALLWHRKVQSGRHKRQELLNDLDRNRRKEADKFSYLEQQLVELDMLRLRMKIHLHREVHRENKERFRLLRERLANCVLGFYESCDFFIAGFLNDEELRVYDTKLDTRSKKTRFKHVHSSADIGYMNELSGPARVRGNLCLVQDILRDDTHKISASTGEYLAFMDTVQGKASLKLPDHETGIFRFLDEGEYGLMMGALAVGEFASLVLLPATGVFYGLDFLMHHGRRAAWKAIVHCEKLITLPSALHSLGVTMTDEDSLARASMVLQYLDITSYSIFASLWDRIHPYATWPMRISRLFWYAPRLYYEYFMTSASAILPPRRICCLLRSGLEAAATETIKLVAKLKEENDILEALRHQDLAQDIRGGTSVAGEDASIEPVSKASQRARHQKKAAITILIDYGSFKEWEAVKGLCLEQTISSYVYKFCFFKDVRQGVTLLGRFKNWGVRGSGEDEGEAPRKSRRFSKKTDASRPAADESPWVINSFEVVGLGNKQSDSSVKKDDAYYSAQVRGIGNFCLLLSSHSRLNRKTSSILAFQHYTNGARCQGQKKTRSVQVTFQCSPDHAILDVVETEICSYDMIVATPMLCTENADALSTASLGKLGVFGYA